MDLTAFALFFASAKWPSSFKQFFSIHFFLVSLFTPPFFFQSLSGQELHATLFISTNSRHTTKEEKNRQGPRQQKKRTTTRKRQTKVMYKPLGWQHEFTSIVSSEQLQDGYYFFVVIDSGSLSYSRQRTSSLEPLDQPCSIYKIITLFFFFLSFLSFTLILLFFFLCCIVFLCALGVVVISLHFACLFQFVVLEASRVAPCSFILSFVCVSICISTAI
jgi:hypothetical protein